LAACNDRAPCTPLRAMPRRRGRRLFPGPGPLARLLRSCPCLRSPRTRTAPAPACMHTLLARTTTRLTENLPLSSSRISYVPHSNASAAHYIYVDGLLLARGSLSLCVRCRGLLWTVRVGGRIGLPQTYAVSSFSIFACHLLSFLPPSRTLFRLYACILHAHWPSACLRHEMRHKVDGVPRRRSVAPCRRCRRVERRNARRRHRAAVRR
jgi:hypothetical protein